MIACCCLFSFRFLQVRLWVGFLLSNTCLQAILLLQPFSDVDETTLLCFLAAVAVFRFLKYAEPQLCLAAPLKITGVMFMLSSVSPTLMQTIISFLFQTIQTVLLMLATGFWVLFLLDHITIYLDSEIQAITNWLLSVKQTVSDYATSLLPLNQLRGFLQIIEM